MNLNRILIDKDNINRTIIQHLELDGRTAFSEIASSLGVSEGTVRNRVNRMKEAGVLRITAVVDPAGVEYQASAMLNIKVARGFSPEEVADRLGLQESVVYILWVAGRYDLIVELVVDSQDELVAFLNDHIYKAKDIADVEVMPGLKNFKNQFLLKRRRNRNGAERNSLQSTPKPDQCISPVFETRSDEADRILDALEQTQS